MSLLGNGSGIAPGSPGRYPPLFIYLVLFVGVKSHFQLRKQLYTETTLHCLEVEKKSTVELELSEMLRMVKKAVNSQFPLNTCIKTVRTSFFLLESDLNFFCLKTPF